MLVPRHRYQLPRLHNENMSVRRIPVDDLAFHLRELGLVLLVRALKLRVTLNCPDVLFAVDAWLVLEAQPHNVQNNWHCSSLGGYSCFADRPD